MVTSAHGRRLRIGRFSEAGRAYLLTTVTHERTLLFNDFTLARLAIGELRACDSTGLSATLAFVLMPDHLHWLIQLQRGQLVDLVKRFKSRSSSRVNRARNTPGTNVWQSGFHDHAIRDDEDIRNLARYIVANPVRAGLVDSARSYPHWDAIWL